MTSTVENYKAEKYELSRGTGSKTVCLTKYVEASFSSPEAFKEANLEDKAISSASFLEKEEGYRR